MLGDFPTAWRQILHSGRAAAEVFQAGRGYSPCREKLRNSDSTASQPAPHLALHLLPLLPHSVHLFQGSWVFLLPTHRVMTPFFKVLCKYLVSLYKLASPCASALGYVYTASCAKDVPTLCRWVCTQPGSAIPLLPWIMLPLLFILMLALTQRP